MVAGALLRDVRTGLDIESVPAADGLLVVDEQQDVVVDTSDSLPRVLKGAR